MECCCLHVEAVNRIAGCLDPDLMAGRSPWMPHTLAMFDGTLVIQGMRRIQ